MAIPNTLIGATGEHLVAAHLSIRGFSTGLTRGGSQSVDVLASCSDGSRSLAIQVKASTDAWKPMPRKGNPPWTFMLSLADLRDADSELFYVFVALDGFPLVKEPRYFMMPAPIVSGRIRERYERKKRAPSIPMPIIYGHEAAKFESRWDLIEARLGAK